MTFTLPIMTCRRKTANLLMPLLEEGKTYFLCLNGQIYHDEQIYNIGGGDQGYGLYDPETGIVTAVNTGERALFSSFEVQKGLYGYNIYNLEPAAGTEEK